MGGLHDKVQVAIANDPLQLAVTTSYDY